MEHEAWRRDVVDEALGLLGADRRADVRRHLEGCAQCREEQEGVRRALAAADGDPMPRSEPSVDLPSLVARVHAELDRRLAVRPRPRFGLAKYWIPAAVAAALVVMMLRARPEPPVADAAVPGRALRQMERTVNREQTVLYLQDAQGLFVSVTTALPRCERAPERRQAGPEARRSRDLLARRRLLVDFEAEHLAAARPLLEDVDHLLGRVAALDPCAQPGELQAITRRMAEKRLLMKMDLMARELMG